jgi:hypothetical protein
VPKVFAGVLMFGLLLCASSTAYADAFSLTSFSFNNLQFTASAGTAQFTVVAAVANAQAGMLGGPQNNMVSSTFPIAQASAVVNQITAAATANAATHSVSAETTAFLSGCSCAAGSFGQAILNGTLVLSGVEGPVNVEISGLRTLLLQVTTDAFGQYAESGLFMDLFVNGTPVFSLQVEALHPLLGPNLSTMLQGSQQISRFITLQGGSTNPISLRLSATSLVINQVPEPASVILLVSGLGFMTGVLKKRRKKIDQ